MMNSKMAHMQAAKNLKRNYKNYSAPKPAAEAEPNSEMASEIEHPGLEAQESKAVRKAEATAGKKKGK